MGRIAKIRLGVLSLVAWCLSAAASVAATVTFDFAAVSTGSWQNSLQYLTPGLNLSVTGGNYPNGFDITGASQVRTYAGSGVGVRSPGDTSGQIDGSGNNDAVILSFSQAVTLNSITFTSVSNGGNEYFDLFASNSGVPTWTALDLTAASNYSFTNPTTAVNFAIGAYYSASSYYVSSVTVTYPDMAPVPLPAAGFVLLAGLGAIGFVGRRRRA